MHKSIDEISANMKKIRNKDSEIELILRRELWNRGLRYRKNYKGVYGCPDIVFIGPKVAIFCDSEFWHGYKWEQHQLDFKTHKNFWLNKIRRNMERDLEVTIKLRDDGWTVLRFWGKQIQENTSACADEIERVIRNEK